MGNVQEQYTVRHDYTMYHDEYSGYTIARYKLAQETADMPKNSVIIAKGYDLPTSKNTSILLDGNWRVDGHRQNRYLDVYNFDTALPETRSGVIDYISSLGVRIGRAKAGKIYDKYGERIWDILENTPDELSSIRGISKTVISNLKRKLDETQQKRKILIQFAGCEEMTPRRAGKIVETYGETALPQILSNPYLLCNIRGFGFQTVDAIAQNLPEYDPKRKERIAAAIQAVFQANYTKGHTCIPKYVALSDLQRILRVNDPDVCRSALNEAHRQKNCRVKGDFCYSRSCFMAEKLVAANVLRILREKPKRKGVEPEKLDRYLDQFQDINGIVLAEEQRNAVKSCFYNNLSIITGGPGTGKSTIIKAILHVAEESNPKRANAMLMAPTGKAARRMEEATGHVASTIHQALGIRYSEDEANSATRGIMSDTEPLETDYIIVDEVSMIDQNLAECLFSRVGDTTSVVLVGDCDQLPSVGAGNVLSELIRSELVPVHRLNVIFRQKEGDPIIINSKKIREGDSELLFDKTFKKFDLRDPDAIFQKACHFYERCVAQFGIENVVMLVPHRVKGKICVNTLNAELQERLNPKREGEMTIRKGGGREFRVGDRVMQTRNTDNAKNGDVGTIVNITDAFSEKDDTKRIQLCDIKFESYNDPLRYDADDMANVDWAYAQSVHKSQGQEYQTVIVVMTGEHELMARRNLLYTAVTRAKENVALIGEMSVFDKAINNCEAETRYTQLADFIRVMNDTIPDGYDPRYFTPISK